jgi:hypothetical protein
MSWAGICNKIAAKVLASQLKRMRPIPQFTVPPSRMYLEPMTTSQFPSRASMAGK